MSDKRFAIRILSKDGKIDIAKLIGEQQTYALYPQLKEIVAMVEETKEVYILSFTIENFTVRVAPVHF